jgi:hypothetical protein
MSELDRKIRDYYNLRPTEFHVLSLLTLSNQIGPGGAYEQVLSLVLQKNLAMLAGSLHLEFQGVRKLVLRQPDWSVISIGFIDISVERDVAGTVGNLFVRDTDQEQVIRFECRDFDAQIK